MKFRFLLISLLLFNSCSMPKDYILMIDTSASMRYGKKVINKIKNNIKDFVSDINTGDTLSLMTFNSQIYSYQTFSINTNTSKADRAKIVKKIISLKAIGLHTDMSLMLQNLEKKAKSLYRKKNGRQLIIVVMSDGLDDPPPYRARKEIKLETLQSRSWFSRLWSDPYIYYISLGNLRDKKTEEALRKISPHLKSLENTESAGLEEVHSDFSWSYFWKVIALLLSFMALLAVCYLFYFLYTKYYKFTGTFIYFEKEVGPFLSERFSLSKVKGHKLYLGKRIGAHLKLRNLLLRENLLLKAGQYKGSPCFKLNKKSMKEITFVRRRFNNKTIIVPGDKFELGDYEFEYQL